MGSATPADGPLVIADRSFASRLIVGTGKYRSNAEMVSAIRASGSEMVTVAVRRVDLDRSREEGILHHLDPAEFFLLPNTAGCYTAPDAVRYARLGRAAGLNDWVKLEVTTAPCSPTPRRRWTRPANSSPTASGCWPTRTTT